MTVIGVATDFRSGRLGILRPDDVNALPQVFFPDVLRPMAGGELLVRTSADPLALVPPIRKIVDGRPGTSLIDPRTLDDQVSVAIAPRDFNTVLTVTFAALALLLAMVGIAGVFSYAVEQRTQEIGVRVALGATDADVQQMVLSHAAKLILAGLAAGLLGSVLVSRFLSGLLYGVAPTDVWTYGAVSLLLVAVALLAAYLPARMAVRVDPIVALRHG